MGHWLTATSTEHGPPNVLVRQVPAVPGRLHAFSSPSHRVLQQRPWTQKPEAQLLSAVHPDPRPPRPVAAAPWLAAGASSRTQPQSVTSRRRQPQERPSPGGPRGSGCWWGFNALMAWDCGPNTRLWARSLSGWLPGAWGMAPPGDGTDEWIGIGHPLTPNGGGHKSHGSRRYRA